MQMNEYRFSKFGRNFRLFAEGDCIVLQESADPQLEQWNWVISRTPIFRAISEIGTIIFRRRDLNPKNRVTALILSESSNDVRESELHDLVTMLSRLYQIS